jgi:hypothetical protein
VTCCGNIAIALLANTITTGTALVAQERSTTVLSLKNPGIAMHGYEGHHIKSGNYTKIQTVPESAQKVLYELIVSEQRAAGRLA